ncbi:putative ubiquitin-conjugating enzyme E2 38 [Magnolia sinica]|uniref:putative ubiquitin-conjugating enzyme E2 38 n=1 Tax=Magnolia sinica TaxID=86752 RepID=UPI00265A5374|nr:putative ubiquitin-conjugating enzyme E2 38 [Magnolia sinica]
MEMNGTQRAAAHSTITSNNHADEIIGAEISNKSRPFNQFDIVHGCSDHHYAKLHKPSRWAKEWNKKIQQEWTVLSKNLPDSIFVRVYEERMDLMRAVIVGATGTPYHDGLFFFDICFPFDYPRRPPNVYYRSRGLKLNPNLYANGTVCLSLLNTSHGRKSELWDPSKSTMLQVLVSIQGLVLNTNPLFNEPSYAKMAGKRSGEKKSSTYNKKVFMLSCKSMLYTIERPPMHFKEFVTAHFRDRAIAILDACKCHIEGGMGGGEGVDDKNFKAHLSLIFPRFLGAFSKMGADCRRFRMKEAVAGSLSGPKVDQSIEKEAEAGAPSVGGPKVDKAKAKGAGGKSWKSFLGFGKSWKVWIESLGICHKPNAS